MTHRAKTASFVLLLAATGCDYGFLPDPESEQQPDVERQQAQEPVYPTHYSPELPETWLYLRLAKTPEPPFHRLFSCEGDCPDYLGGSAYCFEDATGHPFCTPTPSNLTHDHTCLYGHDGYGFCYPNSCEVPEGLRYPIDECADDPLTQNYRYCVELQRESIVMVGNAGTCPFPTATPQIFSFGKCEEHYGACVAEAFSTCADSTECLDGQWFCSEDYYQCLWEESPCEASGAASSPDESITTAHAANESCFVPADCETGVDTCFLAVDDCRGAAQGTYGCESHLQFCEKWSAWCNASADDNDTSQK